MRTLFFGASFGAAFILAQTFGGAIEGNLMPVVTDVEITRAEQISATETRIWGRFNRARDCPFVSIDFYLGNKQRSSKALLRFEEPSKVRDAGITEFGPWVVQLTLEQLEENSYSVASHQCHPFWETETDFH